MRSYGSIPSKFWIEAKEKGLSDDGRQLMAYLMTCHHGNSIGCFRMPVAYIAEDLGWAFERVSTTLSETVSKGFLERDDERSWNRLPNHFETVSVSNPNVAKGMEPFIEAVPKESPLFNNLLEALRPYAKRFRNGYLNGLVNGFETEAVVVASSSSNYLPDITLTEQEAARGDAVDNLELDLNEPNTAALVVAKLVGRRKLSADDHTVLLGWLKNHSMERDVLPWLQKRVENHLAKHGSLPAHPLSYFSAGLTEHLAKSRIK